MSRRALVVLAALVSISATLVVVGKAVPMPPPASGYHWMQPACASLSTPYAQPSASIPIAPLSARPAASGYPWVQPGCAPVTTPYAQPPA